MSKSISKHRALRTVIRYQLFCDPRTIPARLLCPWDFLGTNTGVACRFLLQGIFKHPGINLCLLDWQADSLPLSQ